MKTEDVPTLRDQFAMAAMAGAIPAFKTWAEEECSRGGRGSVNEIMADICYTYADAMLERRYQPTGKGGEKL